MHVYNVFNGCNMTLQSQSYSIDDDTKLVRFLNLSAAKKAIGTTDNRDINCTFHFGFLSNYRKLETNAGDSEEGSTAINLCNGIIGSDTTGNDALVSCWSIWDGLGDPWQAFAASSFTQDKKTVCVIVSTVGKVKKIFEKIVEINKILFSDNFEQIVFTTKHGPVIYYSAVNGVDHEYWKELTNPGKHGIAARTINNIFHKRDSNVSGQRYDAEKEYRFAIVLNPRYFLSSDASVAISSRDAISSDYPLILKGDHYIENVYLRHSHQDIQTTCFFAEIPIISEN
jgi:hypothetical protein